MREQGRKPRKPDPDDEPPVPRPTAQRNFTDPESEIVKTSDGSFHRCFNGQAVVDSHAQVIVAAATGEAPRHPPRDLPLLANHTGTGMGSPTRGGFDGTV